MGRVHTSYSPFVEGLFRTGKGIEEPALVTQGAQWTRAASRDTSSDVIGKCSNQGSRRVSTLHHSLQEPAPSQQQSWVPDAAMGSRLLCCVTVCLLGAGESWIQCGSF